MGEPLDLENLAPGTVLLEKYRVVDTIGIGGMGVVVAADHLQLHTRVAIKFLLPSLVRNEPVNKRFILEARAATKIKSQHVAKVVDVGTFKGEGLPKQGVPFMVMEYLHGRDLSEWVQAGRRFSVEDAATYVIQAAEALAYAHRVGIIHRDVKPANLFLHESDDAPVIKVLDFGISKIMDDPNDLGLTKTTTVLGSGLYMSPEQMRSAKNVDHRTDIYALGVCMYELLTGSQPFTAETFSELCVKVNIEAPTPIREHRTDLPKKFVAVVERAYERDPNQRYQSMAELVGALAPYASASARPMVEKIMSLTSPDVSSEVRAISIPPAAISGSGASHATPTGGDGGSGAMSVVYAAAFAALSLSVGVGAGMLHLEGDEILGPGFGTRAGAPVASVELKTGTSAAARGSGHSSATPDTPASAETTPATSASALSSAAASSAAPAPASAKGAASAKSATSAVASASASPR